MSVELYTEIFFINKISMSEIYKLEEKILTFYRK